MIPCLRNGCDVDEINQYGFLFWKFEIIEAIKLTRKTCGLGWHANENQPLFCGVSVSMPELLKTANILRLIIPRTN